MVPEYGSFTVTARYLTSLGRSSTRQQVYMWWRRRSRNSFPERYEVPVPGKPGKARQMFRLVEVKDWHERYIPSVGGRPRKQSLA
jgi:hypothetical protein